MVPEERQSFMADNRFNTFCWKKISLCQFQLQWILILEVQLTIRQHWFSQWLGTTQPISHHVNQSVTVWCHYNTINCLQNPHKIHPIARPLGRDMGCILWLQILIDILPQSVKWCLQYRVILNCVITALHCIMVKIIVCDYYAHGA